MAVKMPMRKDISSAFLLMQEIFYPRDVDWWMFSDDEQPAEDNANDRREDDMEDLI